MRIHPRAGTPVPVRVGEDTFEAFLPRPLPPDPPVALGAVDAELFEHVAVALGRLDGLSLLVPDPKLHVWLALRKEAVLSSQLDGVGAGVGVSDLIRHEDEPGVEANGVVEVAALAAALTCGVSRLRGGCVLSVELLREMHAVLRPEGGLRASSTAPSGKASFVPPPADEVPAGLTTLEAFLRTSTPVLLRASLGLAQVENLQPFTAGSGRLGRALIVLLLYGEGVLQAPLVYPSVYFKRHRDTYHRRLGALRADGDWEGWVRFVREALGASAEQALVMTRGLLALFDLDREAIAASSRASAGLRVHEAFKRHPLASVDGIRQATGLSAAAADEAVTILERLRIVREHADGVFAYTAYRDLLDEGTVVRPRG